MAGINPKDFDFDAGGWILSCLRIQRGWGAVTDQVFPFDEKAIEEAINTDQFLLPSAFVWIINKSGTQPRFVTACPSKKRHSNPD
jgi:hypothetical protein